MDYDMDISMEMMGSEMNMQQKMAMGANMQIIANNGKESTSKLTYDYFAMYMDNPILGTMSYDSRKEDNEGMMAEAMEASMAELLSSEVITVSNQLGETISTKGAVDNANQTNGGLDMTSMMSMSKFPEKAIAIGESWTSVYAEDSALMKMDMKFTLKDVREGKVYVGFTSTVSKNDAYTSNTENEDGEMISISGTQYGEFVYEEESMWLLESVINQDIDMESEQMGMSIPMNLKGKMTITVK